jgi:hypothetical protein
MFELYFTATIVTNFTDEILNDFFLIKIELICLHVRQPNQKT